MTDNVKLDFLLAMTADHQKTIEALEQEMRARASPLRFMPPEDRPDGYECLAKNSFGIWRHVQWSRRNEWTVRGTFDQIKPIGFAPLPPEAPE
jgi:hypothetical protein